MSETFDNTVKIGITFDDAVVTEYTEGFVYMQSVGIKGTLYVPTAYVGQAGWLSWEQLQEMDAAGWSIANHSQNHINLATITQAEAEAELLAAKVDLENNGMPAAAAHVAYPFGGWNATVLNAMTATGMLSGRTTGTNSFDPNTVNWKLVPCTSFAADSPLVIRAATYPGVCLFLFHELDTELKISTFRGFIDWLLAEGYQFYTIEELYALDT